MSPRDLTAVFLKAGKPENWTPISLDDIALYSVLLGRGARGILDIKIFRLVEGLYLNF